MMQLHSFSCSGRILTGRGCVCALRDMELGRTLIVTDPFFFKNGTAQALVSGTVEYFHKVAPDPDLSLAAEGTALVKSFQPDTVVALGGGSAMDCAKAMVYFSGTKARLIAIPTTSGSGSEVTDFAILTHEGVKHPLVDPRLRPDMAIVDPDLVDKLPPALIADGGFDALTHALEAFVATGSNPFTDALAADAFRTVLNHLPYSHQGNSDSRAAVHIAATMAGLAFTQAGLGLCHAMAHSLGGQFHLPHGRLNAILLPVVMTHCPSGRYATLARLTGLEGQSDTIAQRNLRAVLVRLRKGLGLPATLAQAGISPCQIHAKTSAIVTAALADPCCKTSPVPVTEAMVRKVLLEISGHG
ncbi:MAG: iron-containing alcohol dehydrogenase [Oscillospiraceae bacterium]|nr:iron-containing alcohol dehydrogenase [Oscillospiraceae bacterium]